MHKYFYCTLSALIMVTAVLYAQDMTLTLDDGRDVTLYNDSTWAFKELGTPDISEDVSMTLQDNRILLLRTDNTWSFVKKGQLKKVHKINLMSVNATATAKRGTVTQSSKSATSQALDKIIKKFRTHLKDPKVSTKLITACVKSQYNPKEVHHNVLKDNAVKANIEYNREKIQKVCDCIDEQLEIARLEKAKKKAEAEKK
ncbi:MAG: hypothetical protein GF401_12165 [Chitinivibrionales bacterium]|nr:hypothetical protein [Chitinivibrionales bacterium]